MGRIRTKMIKRVSGIVIEKHSDKFKTTFKENKEVLQKIADIPSKKLRNKIAGCVTSRMKRLKKD